MSSSLEQHFLDKLSTRQAEVLCERLLTQKVSDNFYNNAHISSFELNQKRKVGMLKQWLKSVSLSDNTNNKKQQGNMWFTEIDTIQDIMVNTVRKDMYGNVGQRVSIFLNSPSYVGYIVLNEVDEVKSTPFEAWLLKHKDALITLLPNTLLPKVSP